MARGGARNRSGPAPDMGSGRSDRRGLTMRPLPAAGYDGPVPPWPFTKGTTRERSVWKRIWCYPQADAWSEDAWRWETIAMYVRWKVRAEQPDAGPGIATAMIRLSDQIGLTPAGMAENGWTIVDSELGPDERPTNRDTETSQPAAPVRRLRPVASE